MPFVIHGFVSCFCLVLEIYIFLEHACLHCYGFNSFNGKLMQVGTFALNSIPVYGSDITFI